MAINLIYSLNNMMPIAICMTFVKSIAYCISDQKIKSIMLNATLYTSWYFLICQRHCPIICTMWDPDPDSVYLLIWNNLANNPCHRPGNVHGCLKSTFHETRLENSACVLAEVLIWAPMANGGMYNVQHESMLYFLSQGIHPHIQRKKSLTCKRATWWSKPA